MALFAGFAIGMHVAVLLHEFGHALGSLLSGERVEAIEMLAPLPAGQVLPRVGNKSYAWGGIVFGVLTSFAFWAASRFLAPWPALCYVTLMTAALGLIHNGVYLFIGGLFPFGDASLMIALGASRWFMALLGVPLLIVCVLPLAAAIRLVGSLPSDSVGKRIAIVQAGLLPVPALTVVPVFVLPSQASMRFPMLGLLICFAVCFSVAAWHARPKVEVHKCDSKRNALAGNWSVPISLLAGAALLIFLEWLVFRPR